MTEDNKFRAYLTFYGEFDPNEITRRLGIAPSDAWKKGSRNEMTKFERKFSRWSLESRLDQRLPLVDQIRDVLLQLQGHFDKITQIRAEIEGGLQLVAYFYSELPWFHFEEDIVAACAAMKLSIDCDFYTMYSDRRDDS